MHFFLVMGMVGKGVKVVSSVPKGPKASQV